MNSGVMVVPRGISTLATITDLTEADDPPAPERTWFTPTAGDSAAARDGTHHDDQGPERHVASHAGERPEIRAKE